MKFGGSFMAWNSYKWGEKQLLLIFTNIVNDLPEWNGWDMEKIGQNTKLKEKKENNFFMTDKMWMYDIISKMISMDGNDTGQINK